MTFDDWFAENHGEAFNAAIMYHSAQTAWNHQQSRIERLQVHIAELEAALKAQMQGCTICRGKVKFQGKDFEVCICRYCEKSRAALQQGGE